jgi:hypothetical protein
VFVFHNDARSIRYFVAAVSCVAIAGLTFFMSKSEAQSATPAAAVPIFGITVYPGYRDWKLVSVAHEEGSLNDIRAILGNDVAIKAYRAAKLPFPEGTVIARIAWNYVPSEENNKVFGRTQSFVAGGQPEWYLQFMVKDSKKYAATGGWGYAQFDKDGNPAGEAKMQTCYPCHAPIKDRDFVFTRYAP